MTTAREKLPNEMPLSKRERNRVRSRCGRTSEFEHGELLSLVRSFKKECPPSMPQAGNPTEVCQSVRDHSQLMSERTFFRGGGGREIFKTRSDICILVAFSSGHFRSREGGKNLQKSNYPTDINFVSYSRRTRGVKSSE